MVVEVQYSSVTSDGEYVHFACACTFVHLKMELTPLHASRAANVKLRGGHNQFRVQVSDDSKTERVGEMNHMHRRGHVNSQKDITWPIQSLLDILSSTAHVLLR